MPRAPHTVRQHRAKRRAESASAAKGRRAGGTAQRAGHVVHDGMHPGRAVGDILTREATGSWAMGYERAAECGIFTEMGQKAPGLEPEMNGPAPCEHAC